MKLKEAEPLISLGYFDPVELVDVSIHFDTVTALPSRRWQIPSEDGRMTLTQIMEEGFAAEAERERYRDKELIEVRISHTGNRPKVAIAVKN